MVYVGLSISKRNRIQEYLSSGPLWTFTSLKSLSATIAAVIGHSNARQVYMHIYYLDRRYDLLKENGLIQRSGESCRPYVSKWIVKKPRSTRRIGRTDGFDEIINRHRNIKFSFADEHYVTYPATNGSDATIEG